MLVTFNKHKMKKKKKKKKVTLHMLTHDTMPGCGSTAWVVCMNDKSRDIREKIVTIRSGI
jgi:glutaredoxin-related protein